MNPSCCACQNQAIRVCVHPKCDCIPFLCDNKCKNNIALKLHTHSEQINLIPYSKLEDLLSNIEDKRNEDFLNSIRKKAILIQDRLFQLLQQIQTQLNQNYLRLSKKSISLLESITSKNSEEIVGRDIHLLIQGKDIYQDQNKSQQIISKLKTKYQKMFISVQMVLQGFQIQQLQPKQIKQVKQIYIKKVKQQPVQQIDYETKFIQCLKNGIKLYEGKQYLEALKCFLEGRNYYPFDALTQLRIGQCLGQLSPDDEIKQYKKSIDLGAEKKTLVECYLELTKVYFAQGRNEQGLQMLDLANKQTKNQTLFILRGRFYMKQNDYMNALVCFSEALDINPESVDAKQLMLECQKNLQVIEHLSTILFPKPK